MTTIHVRYEILDDPSSAHPDSPHDAYPWGVRAVGLPENLSAYGVGQTLDEALEDLSEGVRVMHPDGRQVSVPVHGNLPLPAGTLSSICRSVGLTASQLRDLL